MLPSTFHSEYFSALVFLGVAFGFSILFVVANFLLSPKAPYEEKLSAYECGFESFEDSRLRFDIRFYLVTLLFIVFDLEVAFLFPWALALRDLSLAGFWSMIAFLGILCIGFLYEWRKGALDWE